MEHQKKSPRGVDSSAPVVDTLFLNINKKLKNFDNILNVSFRQLRTNFDRFKLVWSIPIMHAPGFFDSVFDSQAFYTPKSSAKSVEYRKEGNEAFKVKDFSLALKKYNLSIRFAEPRSETPVSEKEQHEVDNELALAYANRSAAFFHLNEFALALDDIERAIKYGYPTRLRARLIERKLNCLFNTEQYESLMRCVGSETSDINLIAYFATKVAEQKRGMSYVYTCHAKIQFI
jgi:tetratricopeptide (TPR) repeat protein